MLSLFNICKPCNSTRARRPNKPKNLAGGGQTRLSGIPRTLHRTERKPRGQQSVNQIHRIQLVEHIELQNWNPLAISF